MINTIENARTKRNTKQPNTIKQFHQPFHKRLLNKHFQSIGDFRSGFFSDTELNQILCDSPINLHSTIWREKKTSRNHRSVSRKSALRIVQFLCVDLNLRWNYLNPQTAHQMCLTRTYLGRVHNSKKEVPRVMRAFPRCKEEPAKGKKENVKYPLLERASAILLVTQSNS